MNLSSMMYTVGKTMLSKKQKTIAKFGSKIVTTTASAVVGHKVVKKLSKHDKDINEYDESKRSKKKTERTIRNSLATSSVSAIGTALNTIITDRIEKSA